MSKDNARMLLLCAGLVLVLMGSAANPFSCATPYGGGGQIGGGYADGNEGTVNPGAPENTNRNVVAATITKPDESTVTSSTQGVVTGGGKNMTAYDNATGVNSIILWEINAFSFKEGTWHVCDEAGGNYMKFIDSTTIPTTEYVTYEDTTTFKTEDNPNGCSGILNVLTFNEDVMFAAFNFTATSDTTTPKASNSVVVEGTSYIPW